LFGGDRIWAAAEVALAFALIKYNKDEQNVVNQAKLLGNFTVLS